MSRLKTFVLSPTRVSTLRRAVTICGLGLAMISASSHVAATCSYVIDNQWDVGFGAKIKITNTTGAPINGWTVGWQYAGGNRITSSFNVTLTGANPYSATNISWNGSIPVGGMQEFGFQGTKAAGTSAEIPTITGAACGGAAASSTAAAASSRPAVASIASVAASSVISSGGPAPISVSGNKLMFGGQIGSISGASMFWSNTGWGGEKYYNAQAVSWLKSDWNAKLVRAAMGVNDQGGYLTDPANKTRAMAVIDGAIANNMYVIIDFHSHVAHQYQAQSIAFFQEMATKYGRSNNIIYEVYNEPLAVSWSTVIKPYAVEVIKAIRAIDPDNLIIVGTPNWSQDVDVAANDPIVGYPNIAYTLHFYAGTHKQFLRDKAQIALNKGLPLFVTEWGSTDASGDGAVDVAETNAWVAFMKANNISNANWSLVDKAEGSAALVAGASATGGWGSAQLTASGALTKSIVMGWPAVVGGGSSAATASSVRSSVAPSSIALSSVRSSVAPSSRSGVASSANGAGVLFQDTFESGVVNTQPAGWDNFIGWVHNNGNTLSGAQYALIDSTKSYNGGKSVHFKGGAAPAQIIRALPAGTQRLYTRAYVNMSKPMGAVAGDNHEHIFGLKKTLDANNEIRVGQIKGVLGTNHIPSDNIAPKMDQWFKGPQMAANTWHCVETAYLADQAYDTLYMWVNGNLVHTIDSADDWNNGALAADWMSDKFNYVMFGFHSFSGNSADVWMDDIVVSTQPIGCGTVPPSSSVPSSIASSVRSSVAPSSIPTSSRASSIALSSVRSSVAPSSTPIASSRASSSSAGTGLGNWQLSATDSYLNFVTTKNTHTIEVQKFDVLSGSLTDAGVATLRVDLTSVNTANLLRDQRLRDLFFETGLFPNAIATFNLDTSVLSSIMVGKSAVVDIAGTLDLHGITGLISTKVMVQKLSTTRVMVQSVAPIIVRSSDYNLTAGVEALRAAVGIASVSGTAPVDFVLVYNAQ